MKHNGIFGWALAALLLTGCSSGGDEPAPQPTPPTPPVESPVLTVEEEVILGAEGGEASVAYAVEHPIEGALCDAESEAAWLYDFRFEEAVISFVVDPYDVEAGSEAREATVVVTYPEAESVSFRVRQEADQLLTGIFTLTITRLYPDEVNYTLTVTDPQLTYLIGKTTQKALDEAGGARAVVQQEVQQHLWSENGLEVALKQGDITDGYFMFYADDLQEENFLYLVGVTAEGKITTEVILEALALPDIPVLQLDQPSVEAPSEGGVVTLGYTIQNPIEGEALSVTSKPEDPWVKVESVADGVISLHCEPNPNNVERTAEIRLSYRSMPMQTILLKQAPNIEEEPLTFELEVVESHWNRVVVNCTPSDPTAYYIIDSIAKTYYEGSGDKMNYAGGLDANIPGTDLWNPYRLTILQGPQTNYVITNTVYSEMLGWDFYVYAYGVDKSFAPTAATSEVEKQLVTLPDDRPIIRFEEVEASYPAAGANITIAYTIQNPLEGGYLQIKNQHPTVISNLDDSVEGQLSFTLAPNSAYVERTASLLFEYYLPDNEYVPVATAELKLRQEAAL